MRLFCRFAAVLMTVVFVAACGDDPSSEFGEPNTIELTNGALIPETEDVQHEPVEGSIGDLRFASLVDDSHDTFASHLDKPLVVNFFAAWCGPCRAELPEFEAVYQELKDEVNFLGVSRDASATPSLELLADTGVSFPSGWDSNGSLFADLGLIAMPSTLMVDRNGVVVEQWAGVLTTESLHNLITDHLP